MKYPWPSTVTDSDADGMSVVTGDSARPLDGLKLAAEIKADLKHRVEALRAQGVTPGLGTLLVGEDAASQVYVGAKHKDCAEVGIESVDLRLGADATQEQVEAAIDAMNNDPGVTAFIVQLPVPGHLDTSALLRRMDPSKDADGLHPFNLGRLVEDVSGQGHFPRPCTPRGIIELLRANGISLKGARVCVVGRGLTVGRPLALMLTSRDVGATAVLCHTGTEDLAAELRGADVVIGAAGAPDLITAESVKPGAVVVDVGVARRNGKIAGDAAEGVEQVAGWLSPNPGGVGPMTRAMLLSNVVEIAEQQQA